jgi:uncharacterized protein YprB with RNaseH-like and TPR domain
MARSGLAGRLGRIRETERIRKTVERETSVSFEIDSPDGTPKEAGENDEAPTVIAGNGDESGLARELAGWAITAPFLHERVKDVPCDPYRENLSPYLPLLFPREKETLAAALDAGDFPARCVFFDLETTGLSHGAGTVAFMAGIARFVSDSDGKHSLRVHQIILDDYPGEISFLSRFDELVGDNPVFVSFNGKCFDSQILATRFLMNGMRPRCMTGDVLHLDLLFPSRRLWKDALGSCRLSAIEEGILALHRVDDLPGSEAPEAWFDFVRSGIDARLLAIGDHNRDDCASLALLLFALDEAIDSGIGRAALVRALALRSERDYAGAALFLAPLAELGDRTALRLLAVDSEHRLLDLDRALVCAEELGDEKRIGRIRNKMERLGAAGETDGGLL